MASWEETAQAWGGLILNGAVQQEFYQDYELAKLKLQALGDKGYYTEGKAGTVTSSGGAVVLPSSLLLLGGLAVLLFILKD